jgi:tetratricopeptide (TPR) repeat protein
MTLTMSIRHNFPLRFFIGAALGALLLSGCDAAARPSAIGTPFPVRIAATTVNQQMPPAVATAQAAADASPNDPDASYRLGNALSIAASEEPDAALRRTYFEGAITAYKRALELKPADAAVLHNLGTAYLQIGDLATAARQFEAALAIDDSDPKTLYMVGTIYLQQDQYGSPQTNLRAREKFEAALRIDPTLAVAYVGLAQISINEGDAAGALENARKGVELSGDAVDPFTYWQLAQAQCATGDIAGGTETLNKILAANVPNDAFNQQVRMLMDACK